MISVNNLKFSYQKEKSFHFPDIKLSDGEDLLIIGESGVGKTTLLHLMAGILKPERGSIVFDSVDITEIGKQSLDQFRGKNVGVVFQKSFFIRSLTVMENLLLVQNLAKVKQDKQRVESVLDQLGILDKRKNKPYSLSQGEQQRVSIAMAVLNKPKVLLADEPTASLDDKNCLKVLSLLKEEASLEKAHLVMITHDQRVKAHFKNQMEL